MTMLVKTVKASWSCRFWLALAFVASFLLPRRQSPNRQYFLLQWSEGRGRAQPTKARELSISYRSRVEPITAPHPPPPPSLTSS